MELPRDIAVRGHLIGCSSAPVLCAWNTYPEARRLWIDEDGLHFALLIGEKAASRESQMLMQCQRHLEGSDIQVSL
jgi:hypothetical protein